MVRCHFRLLHQDPTFHAAVLGLLYAEGFLSLLVLCVLGTSEEDWPVTPCCPVFLMIGTKLYNLGGLYLSTKNVVPTVVFFPSKLQVI